MVIIERQGAGSGYGCHQMFRLSQCRPKSMQGHVDHDQGTDDIERRSDLMGLLGRIGNEMSQTCRDETVEQGLRQ